MMNAKPILLSFAITLVLCGVAFSQQPAREVYVAPNAPKDKPIDAQATEAERIEAAIKPYIEKARATYPEAKARFLNGLPPKQTFFITTRLYDLPTRFEQVFIAVSDIKDGKVTGIIASEIRLVSGYKEGDAFSFPESQLIDWTITKPDGTEEGNFVGNFLDSFQVTHAVTPGEWRNQPVTPAHMNERLEQAGVQYAADAPVPRIVLYDIGYPKDEAEYTALGGNAVMLLTSVSQNRDELPLQRVYVTSDGKEIELKRLKVVLAEMPNSNSASAKTFGRFRADALYLLPMSLRVKNADLLVDFQINRSAFKIATFGIPLTNDLNRLTQIKLPADGPLDAAIETFIKREYPSFFQQ